MSSETLSIPETGESIRTAHRRVDCGGQSYEIVVNADERDEITLAILEGRWQMPAHYDLLRAVGAAGGRVLDIGAHIGTFALFAAALGCRVLAMEASPRNAALLRSSIARNGFADLRVVCTAVGASAGTTRFLQAGPYGFVARDGVVSTPTLVVPMATVDDLLASVNWGSVEFVKMDIEGSEVAALAGMRRLLGIPTAPPIVFESNGHTLNLLGHTPADVRGVLDAAGYRCYLVRPGRLIPVSPADLQPECNVDYLAVRAPLSTMPGWDIAAPMAPGDELAAVLASSADPNPHVRAYIARALGTASASLLGNPDVRAALVRLADDPSDDVRAAAAWFRR